MALDALYLLKLLLKSGPPIAIIPQVGKGNAEVALSLVGYDQELKSAIKCVFGSTFVCKTIDAARAMDCHPRKRPRLGWDIAPQALKEGATKEDIKRLPK